MPHDHAAPLLPLLPRCCPTAATAATPPFAQDEADLTPLDEGLLEGKQTVLSDVETAKQAFVDR